MENKQKLILVGVIAGVATVVILVVVCVLMSPDQAEPWPGLPDRLDPASCPADYQKHGDRPLLLVSMDGFRADYLSRGLTPTLRQLHERGIVAPLMKPSFPTKTFPNHYTIVTGLYPESHGIVGNKFFDPEFNATFKLGSDESRKPRWWGGDPIWNTVRKQGKKSATFFWPGSDVAIEGLHPTYYYNYSDHTPFEERVDQVLEWLSLPKEERPSWVSMYLNEPDHTGHDKGPDSLEVNEMLVMVDLTIQRLIWGLQDRNLLSCVNLILLADHGMAEAGEERIIKIKPYVPGIYDIGNVFAGAFARIQPDDHDPAVVNGILKNLTCQRSEMRAYPRTGLPTRFHFTNNRRIEEVVLDLDPGYTVSYSSNWFLEGQHGYDNYFSQMDAVFMAYGPDLKDGFEVEPFQNIELYNLMCHLVGVDPAPNNGTWGALNHLLVNPPQEPILPPAVTPPAAEFPDADQLPDRLVESGCPGDLDEVEPWMKFLNVTVEQQADIEAAHLPWGLPRHLFEDDLVLLHHEDHITGYSTKLHMPLWTSFTLRGGDEGPPGTPDSEWSSDVRLEANDSATCSQFQQLLTTNASMEPLFPPMFSQNASSPRVPFLVSNAVPITHRLRKRWHWLLNASLPAWAATSNNVNVLAGPVFDHDADSFADSDVVFRTPSHLFLVVTRCTLPVADLSVCPHKNLDAIAFVMPEPQEVPNCFQSDDTYDLEFSAKVRDVEKVTGLTLFPELPFRDRTRLLLRIHDKLWPRDFGSSKPKAKLPKTSSAGHGRVPLSMGTHRR
ncbi:venom phosphodiesterase-like isoform X2 [Oratosquilla oratoria]|uniref:venom phosphodiesterase-like isoform X1 n=1 Tax=Oratosquilla oratoria TaxID=337810 RepID=UPI003F765980